MNLLITGATGFIGGFLVEQALEQNYTVFAAVRKSSNTTHLSSLSNVEIIILDFDDPLKISETIDRYNIDFIINNAGLTRSKSEEKMNLVNAQYVANILLGTEKASKQIKRLVHISSLAAYGPADFTKSGVVDNSSTTNPVTMYGRSKLKGENYLKNQAHTPYCIIRPTAVYGPKEKDLFTIFKMINNGIQTKVGFQNQKLTFIYVKDLVCYMINALTEGKDNESYFISDGKSYSNHQLNEEIRLALHKKTIKLTIPIFVVKILAYLSEWWGKITNTFPPLNIDKFQEIKAQSWVCDTSPNTRLKHTPTYSLTMGIKETVAWYKTNKWL